MTRRKPINLSAESNADNGTQSFQILQNHTANPSPDSARGGGVTGGGASEGPQRDEIASRQRVDSSLMHTSARGTCDANSHIANSMGGNMSSDGVARLPQSQLEQSQRSQQLDQPGVPDAERFAEGLSNGLSLYDAMRAAGYSESSARMGKLALSKRMLGELGKMGKWYAEIGKQLDPQLVEDMIAGRTYVNALSGTGKEANEALKLLGNMSRFKVFEPENQQQVLVVQAPAGWLEMTGLAKQLPQQQISSSPQPKQLEAECSLDDTQRFPQTGQLGDPTAK